MRWGRRIVVGLIALCLTFLASTVWLYSASNEQKQRTYLSSRSSAWVNYQAQIEYLKTLSALQYCAAQPDCHTGEVAAQVKSLAMRLRSLIELEQQEERPVHGERLERFQQMLLDNAATIAGSSTIDPAALQREILPLGDLLQTALGAAVSRPINSGGADDLLAGVDASIPFLLLVASGIGLMTVLAFELRQRGGLLREISTLRQAERQSQAGTVELLEALPIPVLVIADGDRVKYANRAAENLVGAPTGTGEFGRFATIVGQQSGALATSESTSRDFPVGNGDGSVRHLSVRAKGMRLLGEDVRMYVISDNTLLRDAELRVMTAGKLAVLGELSSAIAHELNQPLAVIKAAAANGRMRAEAIEGGDRLIDKFVRIDEQTERARRIIDNVRKLGRPAQAHWTPFSLARSLGSSLGLVSQQYRLSGVGLEIDVDVADGVMVFGDPTLFEIAVLNVLMNAREAFAHAGRNAGPPAVRLSARMEAGGIRIVVSDNAGGIPAYILPQIFNSFVSSKPAEVGTGLGLSIARRAIEEMNGTINAENGLDGAVFTIWLPTQAQQEAAA